MSEDKEPTAEVTCKVIDKDSKIMCRMLMTGHGEKGSYFRLYDLTLGGESLGVAQQITAEDRNTKATVRYITDAGEFDNVTDALRSAGHTVNRELKS